jgi:hypothetical protein
MQPEGSLPPSQVPATCPYPETRRSSPYPHNPLQNNTLIKPNSLYILVDMVKTKVCEIQADQV